eukprot:TRINITY_DN35226_c0_g1_i1.p1 TRINITY_DN35226_c0_g1~~TRINITY_DN35226_c0_g1_i1.p1  ORF type:complete len:132 (-),score=14.21 TRINITY_DN35226_c0_g1_i1:73-468(-)
MGIEGYRKWVQSQFPNSFVPLPPSGGRAQPLTYEHIYFDMNSIIHETVRKGVKFDQAIQVIFRKLDGFFMHFLPTRSVVLALDGPGPMGKILTQRKRRFPKPTIRHTQPTTGGAGGKGEEDEQADEKEDGV